LRFEFSVFVAIVPFGHDRVTGPFGSGRELLMKSSLGERRVRAVGGATATTFVLVYVSVAHLAAGQSVLDGVYTVEQAKRGEAAYAKECASCHLDDLSGTDRGPSLAGDTFLDAWTDRSVGALFDRTHKTMPQDRPGALSAAMTRDIVAFLLRANGSPAGAAELPADVAVLNAIRITRKTSQGLRP
jgi:mono/diheme cytochrome c family protein